MLAVLMYNMHITTANIKAPIKSLCKNPNIKEDDKMAVLIPNLIVKRCKITPLNRNSSTIGAIITAIMNSIKFKKGANGVSLEVKKTLVEGR
jgi:hypothetical protein